MSPPEDSAANAAAFGLGDEISQEKPDSPDRDVSSHTEVGGVEDLVCRGVGKDGLGVDTGLVGKGAETGDVVVAAQSAPRSESRSEST
jgi:hypothetical protein